ncbi:MAG: DUF11 domain-containing protein [Caldilineaceae bacterium]|nr:DUF11 domain-containing protein [Caldilineaceae bacterium]
MKSMPRRPGYWMAAAGLLLLTVVVALVSAPAPISAQDNATPAAGAARLYLPVLANSAAPNALDMPAVGVAETGNIDGAWSNPRSDLGVTPVTCQDINNSPELLTNENTVRYGQPIGSVDCGNVVFRSGFGFDGTDAASFAPDQPFILGQFTHYNENIVTPLVPMQLVDFAVRIQVPAPFVDATMNYTMRLDETLNDGSCPYGSTNQDLCDDRVDFVNNSPSQTIVIDGVTYTLNIIGFVPGTVDSCQFSEAMPDYFITGELMRNEACIFAEWVQPTPAIAIAKSPDVQQIAIGDFAEFTITVSAPGNVGFDTVSVADPLTPDCDQEIGALKAGATESYVCAAYGVESDFENEAIATGIFAGVAYSARDTAIVDVAAPDTATVIGIKYHDQNGNGQRDAGEPGLTGWTLCVRDDTGANVGFCQVTDAGGQAILAPNAAGDFQLCEVLQPGWTNTDPGGATACKPVSVTAAPSYAEFYPTVNDIYGVELVDKSADQLRWSYTAYQFLASRTLDAWVLALPSCIDEAQIDASATTAGWSLVTDAGTGLRGVRWATPAGVPPEGTTFTLALRAPYATGAGAAGVTAGGATPIYATQPVAGPVCDAPVLLGNTADAAPTGTLEVRKVLVPAGDSGRFNLLIDGEIAAGDVGNAGTTGVRTVPVGVHVIAEGAGAATDLADYQAAARCVETTSGSSWIPGADGRIFVDEGEAVVCTFTNIRLGTVTVTKTVSGEATSDWAFSGNLGDFTLAAAGGERVFARLAPGSYAVIEAARPGWSLAALTCADPNFNTQVNLTTATATISLEPGESVACTYTNVAAAGSVTIIKQVNGTATAPWSFDGTLGDFSIAAAGGEQRFDNVAPGSYTVRERTPEGWRVSALTCVDPDGGSSGDPLLATATIDLDGGEAITCTFVNDPGTPAIALEKQAGATIVYPNTEVAYAFAVTNAGDVPLSAVRVDDPLCTTAPVLNGAANIGDTDSDGWLDVGEIWQFTCTATLSADTTNTATAWGTAPWGEEVWATNSAFVDVIAPQLSLVKTADRSEVVAGETVTFRIEVANQGDTPLTNVVVDDGLPACALSAPAGDDGNGALDPGETWVYTCAMAITADTTNTATGEGLDVLGNRWTASDSATVTVIRPGIDIVKRADRQFVYPGETIQFTLDVRNTGSAPLYEVVVTDSLPQCQLAGPSGDDGDGVLATGEVWSYTCAVPVCEGEYFPLPDAVHLAGSPAVGGLCSDVTNTGAVTAKNPSGQPVSDEDTVFVDLIRPAIQVIKLADRTDIWPGETVTFDIYVKNVGDTTLTDITLTDSLPACVLSAPTGDDGDAALAPGEEWAYTCSAAIEVDTVNTARATGKDPRGTVWWDEDSVAIYVCID